MRALYILSLFGMACTSDKGTDTAAPLSLDLTERLGAGQARAGVMDSDAAGIGGMAAEGQAGDIKIYNDRVQFIIQETERGTTWRIAPVGWSMPISFVQRASWAAIMSMIGCPWRGSVI